MASRAAWHRTRRRATIDFKSDVFSNHRGSFGQRDAGNKAGRWAGRSPRYTIRRADTLPTCLPPGTTPPGRAPRPSLCHAFIRAAHARVAAATNRSRRPACLHDGHALAIIFRVEDRYVLARSTAYQSPTHKESCVEFFARPRADRGYFNFEWNAIGTLAAVVRRKAAPSRRQLREIQRGAGRHRADDRGAARRSPTRSATNIPVPWSGPSPP